MRHLIAAFLIGGIYLGNTVNTNADRYPKAPKYEEFRYPMRITGAPWTGKDDCAFNNVA